MVQIASISGAPVAEAVEESARSDRRMANLALSLEMELASTDTPETKWTMGSTIGFAVIASAALWGVIGVIAWFAL